ncbi:MAG: c-type cytochrome [Gammaproteobacteria bacterium]|jgi:cytochrome c|nr:c-type cytochrome [Gammaproteobacteria bacterium]
MPIDRKPFLICAMLIAPLSAQAAAMPDWVAPPTWDCRTCHAIDSKLIGPSWNDVAQRYKDEPGAVEMLKGKIRDGGVGNWNDVTGGVPMPPHPRLTDEDLGKVVEFILSLAH